MAEYIEREALILENLEKYMTVMEVNTSEYGNQTVVAVDDLMYLPIADVAEVKHSEWKCSSVSMKTRNITCRLCRRTETISNGRNNFDYCPNCGARMDSEDG